MSISFDEQMRTLGSYPAVFEEFVPEKRLSAKTLRIFQVNIGRWCNQACKHCHVDAGPNREEKMSRVNMQKCIDIILATPDIEIVDITGGAAEGHPHFQWFVKEIRKTGRHVIDRCNLTILEEPGFTWLYDFLAENHVEIVASLPHYAPQRTDTQRGTGVFEKSIRALRKLNSLGYGSTLPLHLVYNPSGIFLSAPQAQLEREFKEELKRNYEILFHNLYCINNMPINRYLRALMKAGKFEQYMNTLVSAFNLATVDGLMCRHQISVGYDGSVYDCDFNQMLEIKSRNVYHIKDFNREAFLRRSIVTANHCFGCTAGAGSSCGGEII